MTKSNYIITISDFDADEVVRAAWRVSRRCLVTHAHTISDDAATEMFDRLGITPDWRSPCSWGGHLDRLLQCIEKSEKKYKLLVISVFDELKTPRRNWTDIVGYAQAKGLVVWCCAKDTKSLKGLRARGLEMTLVEAERAMMERLDELANERQRAA